MTNDPHASHESDSTHGFAAFCETHHAAEAAKAEVVAAGISHDAVKITDGHGSVTGRAHAAPREGTGLVATLKNVWAQDLPSREEELKRPGFVVTAHVPTARAAEVREILGRHGAILDDYA